MSDQAKAPELHLDEKWDKVINSMFSRSAMGGLAGAVAGFLLFSALLASKRPCCQPVTQVPAQMYLMYFITCYSCSLDLVGRLCGGK